MMTGGGPGIGARSLSTHLPSTAVLIFDGNCGFCSSSARFTRHWVDRRRRFAIEPFQRLDLATFGLTVEQASQEAWFVTPSGIKYAGAQAISAALRAGAPLWRPVGWLLAAPGLRSLAELIYRWVSANRSRLPGGPPWCS